MKLPSNKLHSSLTSLSHEDYMAKTPERPHQSALIKGSPERTIRFTPRPGIRTAGVLAID
ncbi:Orotidine 5'-phosphate decarboxylase [Clarias magur]|uniref:Orotidine 5'-phosphate decarboxylase n=1 Tax=Clarias magur TaxID=1594786 RepID=A0A8J4UKV7_CLAMG|nr:Orotidine 5'-phosphate decarboxylase [Clarias magur]